MFSKYGKRAYNEEEQYEYMEPFNSRIGLMRYGKKSDPYEVIHLCEDSEEENKFPLPLTGFAFSNFGQRQLKNMRNIKRFLNRNNIRLIKREIDPENLKYLEGFGFGLGHVGKRSHGKAKRDSIVGIAQWGRKKRDTSNMEHPPRYN